MRPHRVKYWLNAKPADPREFASQVRTVCEVYRDAIALFERHGVHTVSIDEQTGIQALERIASDKLPRPGQVARLEYEYRRHGTTGLFGNLHIATGRILSPLVRQTRTEDDFVENIDNLVQTDSSARWRFVVDNLNTHGRNPASGCMPLMVPSLPIQIRPSSPSRIKRSWTASSESESRSM